MSTTLHETPATAPTAGGHALPDEAELAAYNLNRFAGFVVALEKGRRRAPSTPAQHAHDALAELAAPARQSEYTRRSPKLAAPRSARRAARGRERRAAASSRSAGCDPGDSSGPSDLPAPAHLALAPKPKAILTYGFAPEASR